MSETQDEFTEGPVAPEDAAIDGRRRSHRWGAGLAAFALITYMGLRGGGFDAIVYGQVGIGLWWALILGAAVGVAGLGETPKAAKIVLVALGLLVAWTTLSMLWSESADRSAQEAARASTYLAILAGGVMLRRLGGLRPVLVGVVAGLGVITVVGLLQRMEPSWLPDNETINFVSAARARLNFPVNSWNGLASLLAMAAPVTLLFAARGAARWSAALATAALPLLVLATYLTLSRGGTLAMALGVAALFALFPSRRSLIPPLAIGGAGGAVLIAMAAARPTFTDGLDNLDASGAGTEMLLISIGVCAAAAALSLLTTTYAYPLTPPIPRVGVRPKLLLAGVAVLAIVAVGLTAGVPSELDQQWQEFKVPEVQRGDGRLASASGNGRYQWWSAAVDAHESEPWLGIGAGTFRFWWSRNATFDGQVVDAHSLYLESLGELGYVGFALILVLVGGGIAMVAASSLRSRPGHRATLAAASAAMVAFAVGAGSDWSWELPVVPATFLLISGAALAGGRPITISTAEQSPRGRFALGLLGLVGAAIVALPTLGADAIRASQERASVSDLGGALLAAEDADRIEPYSASVTVRRAQLHQALGELNKAAQLARVATEEESTNWETFLVLSSIEYERGKDARALEAIRRARELNPFAPIFADPTVGEGEARRG